jgi:hypothetical protein
MTIIDGKIPLNSKKTLKKALITGEFPPMYSKNVKMGDFYLHKRKISPYIPQKELHFAFNRKISAYFPFASNLTHYGQAFLRDKEAFLGRNFNNIMNEGVRDSFPDFL